ncbi:MAG: hypothetical protein PSV35_04240, partial [bacterium]|nr:hypothetical protein [bacterium]
MLYVLKGNAQLIFPAFGLGRIVAKQMEGQIPTLELVNQDLIKTPFLGTDIQANLHSNEWRQNVHLQYYSQGNMSGAHLNALLGTRGQTLFHSSDFAFVNEHSQLCTLVISYNPKNPRQWMIGLIKNPHLAPAQRIIICLSSMNLKGLMTSGANKIAVVATEGLNNPLINELDSLFLNGFIKKIIHPDEETIDVNCARIDQLLRYIAYPNMNELIDPLPLNEQLIQQLFRGNSTLDMIHKYKLRLSTAMLHDCLRVDSGLNKQVARLNFSEDEKINKNKLQLVITFYEQGLLSTYDDLLKKQLFKKAESGSIWDEQQIKLMPLLLQKGYSLTLFQTILAKAAYYDAVAELAVMGFTQDIPLLFAVENKLHELDLIHNMLDPACKKICLVFWVKGNLTRQEYQDIVNATQKHPFLAETLLALDRTHTVSIDELRLLALNPNKHHEQSILYHFKEEFSAFTLNASSLDKLDQMELAALSLSFKVLKNSEIKQADSYRLVLNNSYQGQLLRLCLPGLAEIKNVAYRKELIRILYLG